MAYFGADIKNIIAEILEAKKSKGGERTCILWDAEGHWELFIRLRHLWRRSVLP